MRILVVSSYLPFPLFSGGNIRLYNLLKLMTKKHKITLICEKRPNQTNEDVEEVEKVCEKVITVERKKQWSTKNILKTGFSKNPFLITGHTSLEMKNAIIEELEKEKYDVIHVETSYVMQNLPQTTIPVVLVEHNIEYLVYKRFADNVSIIARPVLFLDILKLKRLEEYFWKKADKLIAVSDVEKKIMKREDTVIVPNGVDLNKFKFQEVKSKFAADEKRILFIGDFKWMQNRDAINFIIKQIWPKIDSKFNLKLWIVGRNIPSNIKNLTDDPNIIFDDNNKDKTEEIYEKSFLLLAPIRIGGGTSYKILEAMATGTAVVTTNLGIEGLGAKNEDQVLTAETAQEISGNVMRLVEDKNLYEKLTRNARDFVEENYSWEKIVKKLEAVYLSVVN